MNSSLHGVVILNYNNASQTIDCVNSIKQQECSLIICVVDNCSNDNSYDVLFDTFKNSENIILLRNETNAGYAAGNNFGLRYLKENFPSIKYFTIANPDIIISDNNLFNKLEKVLSDENIAVVSCKTIFNNQDRGLYDFGWHLPDKKRLFFAGTFFGKVILDDINKRYSELELSNNYMFVDVIPGCFFMARADIFAEVNYFDEDTFLYFEESILAKKIKKLGKKEAICVDTCFYHNHQDKDKDLLNRKKRYFDRKCFYDSKMYYIKKYSDIKGIALGICKFINGFDLLLKKLVYNK